ncbi:hypothetical protein FQA39_LY04807 [Lamprigera yunnana]|nr:hypothetical protein FQA39_LY04807 [Lamprigera yunnana]
MDQNIRTFKDFLEIYNVLSNKCFKRCVDNLNSRHLNQNEIECVDRCSEKFIKLNHRFMPMYVENQQILVNRRVKEIEESQLKDNKEETIVINGQISNDEVIPAMDVPVS